MEMGGEEEAGGGGVRMMCGEEEAGGGGVMCGGGRRGGSRWVMCVCAPCVQSEMIQRMELVSVRGNQLKEDHRSKLQEAAQCSREREREWRTKKQQLEEKL